MRKWENASLEVLTVSMTEYSHEVDNHYDYVYADGDGALHAKGFYFRELYDKYGKKLS